MSHLRGASLEKVLIRNIESFRLNVSLLYSEATKSFWFITNTKEG